MTDPLELRRILVPTDFSSTAQRALELARDLATAAGPAHITLLHCYDVPPELLFFVPDRVSPYLERLSASAEKRLEEALIELQDAGVSSEYVAANGAPERIIPTLAAEKQADLIVMGTNGRSGIARFALGSVAERVIRTAPCPVLTVKGG